jgi:Peptidase family M28
MKRIVFVFLLFSIGQYSFAQTNVKMTNLEVENILMGIYNPIQYEVTSDFSNHRNIICGLQNNISTDSLKSHLTKLNGFYTRNTYSDTLSDKIGIGAARSWAYDKFVSFGIANGDRLISSYLQFDYPGGSCGDGFGWKNVIGVIPGIDTTINSVIIIEAHLDSRCEEVCDINCFAAGIEDNGSGSALVIELARVMSRYSFNHTIVFMLTVGEEQGLYGAKAMAKYCEDKGLKIKAVLNNDVVGGITCGITSSPPSCEGEGSIDSTQVRIFSNGGLSLPHRGLARTIKLYYDEKLKSIADVPMTVSIMDQEDRTGRGGDHIPFRAKGYPSIRFTAANEHGNARPDDDYKDRQHTTRDVLGIDTNDDQQLDLYYVDFNYLKRNAVINGASACLIGQGPETPEFTVHDESTGLRVKITNNFANEYRVGVRGLSSTQNFDAIYRTTQSEYVVPNLLAGTAYRISVASINDNGITSPFSGEILKINDTETVSGSQDPLNYQISCKNLGESPSLSLKGNEFILGCTPNPNNGLFTIRVTTSVDIQRSEAHIVITNLLGEEVQVLPFQLNPGLVEVNFDVALSSGQYIYSLHINDVLMESKKLIVE